MPSNDLPSVLNDTARGNLIDFVERVVGTTLGQSLDYTADFPGFLADPAPAVGPFAVAKAIGQQSCRRWARGQGIPSLPGFDALYGGICKPYLEGLGEMPSDGSIGPPFEGGQCSAAYIVSLQRVNDDGSTPNPPFDRRTRGPIAGTRRVQIAPGTPPTYSLQLGSHSTPQASSNCGSAPEEGFAYRQIGTGAGQSLRILGVTPCAADNCGNPPVEYDPPNIPPGLPPLSPITINVPGIGDVAVDVGFGENGEILISLPDLGIDLEIPNPLFDGGGGEEPPTPPGYQGNPDTPIDVGPGDAADETADSNLVGVLVQTIQTPPRSNRLYNQTESYTKGAYFVYFGGDGGLSQNPEAAITRQDQFFYAPEGCNRFRVVPNSGFTLRVTPYYED